MFRSTRRKTVRSAVASFALAVALAGGAAVGSAAFTSEAAYAQNSRGFAEVYQPLAEMVNATPPNFEGARTAIPTLIAAIENPNDRQLAGNLILNIGNNTSDPALQRQGLEMMLESGLVPVEQQGQFNWFVGSLAFQADDYAAARESFEVTKSLGYAPEGTDLDVLIAETHFQQDNVNAGVQHLVGAITAAEAAGTAVNQSWITNALQAAYDYDLTDQALVLSEKLIQHHPSQRNWENALRILNQLYELPEDARVDLSRLMRLNNAIIDRQEYIRYIEDLDPRVMSNEVQLVLAMGLDNGVFEADDPYYVEVKGIADQRAPQDRNGIDDIISEGQNGDALDALSAGDVLYSLSDFAQAETMYKLALERGYDAGTANTRIGITQAEQGNYAAAIETFGLVTGQRAPVARMWVAYAQQQMAGN
ncbi:hypothetical protein [Aurantiacibacter gilvus]|uniref:Tetratricopeptide repeat protein n=1 Tax=Aurantiacibacter gilvus TaxID=3139141 RepID=A0ABU9ICT3_9SPHN